MEGQCQCGAIKFTAPTAKPLLVYICHCLECRRQSGSAFGTSAIFPKFELPDSPDLTYWTRITAAGQEKLNWFCKKCGSRLFHTKGSQAAGTVLTVKSGVFGENLTPEMIRNATHIWTKMAVVPIPEGVERHEEDPPDN